MFNFEWFMAYLYLYVFVCFFGTAQKPKKAVVPQPWEVAKGCVAVMIWVEASSFKFQIP